jgi:hypothetical protein
MTFIGNNGDSLWTVNSERYLTRSEELEIMDDIIEDMKKAAYWRIIMNKITTFFSTVQEEVLLSR